MFQQNNEGEMSSLRRPSLRSPAPLEDKDLLSEILLRLPPHPSTLPRVSAVCRSWRSLVTDARFIRRFRLHHRHNPLLLGYYVRDFDNLSFVPTLEAPNRVPIRILRFGRGSAFQLVGCHHGGNRIVVWDPVTAEEHSITVPPVFEHNALTRGAVLRRAAAGDVLLVVADYDEELHSWLAIACVYASETGVWGNLISTPVPSQVNTVVRAVLVENSLYWLLGTRNIGEILEFSLERHSLAAVQLPMDMSEFNEDNFSVMQAEGGGLGFLLWKRKIDSNGIVSWGLRRAIEPEKLLSWDVRLKRQPLLPYIYY